MTADIERELVPPFFTNLSTHLADFPSLLQLNLMDANNFNNFADPSPIPKLTIWTQTSLLSVPSDGILFLNLEPVKHLHIEF